MFDSFILGLPWAIIIAWFIFFIRQLRNPESKMMPLIYMTCFVWTVAVGLWVISIFMLLS